MIEDIAAAKAAEYHGLFATPIITSEIPEAETLIADLKAVVVARAESHPTDSRSNKGGWQSDTQMLQWGGPAAITLATQVLHMCARFTRDVGQTDPNNPRFQWMAEMWANVCPPTVGHESHTHPGSLWSIVFYLDNGLAAGEPEENAGQIVLQDPRNPMPVLYKPDLRMMEPGGETYRSEKRITPKVGQLIAFPAWLSHWVTPHRGSRDRISIAINTMAVATRQ